jgi:small subunit ribosomal protein S1
MESFQVGEIREMVVTRLEPYGAWVECQGKRGLVTIPEISWTRIGHPSDVLHVGSRIWAKIVTRMEGRDFGASIRQVHPEQDPWYAPSRFPPGSEFDAPVVRVMEYGVFVEIRPEIWGLLPKELLPCAFQVGDRLRVRVEEVDTERRKVGLSLLSPAKE